MPWITQDPTGLICPDYTGQTYAAVRLAMSTGGQLNDAGAVEQLIAAWNQAHTQELEAWNIQTQADVAEQEEQRTLAEAEEERLRTENERQKEDEQKELEKKRPKINDFDDERMVGDFVIPRPSQFAVGKLKSFSFTELWYFTEEGCAEAQESSRTLPEDAYGITRIDDLVALKPVAAFKASRNAVSDADLTWRQMNIGKNTMLRYMELCNWPPKHVESFARFYFHLELDPMRSRPNGERVLLAYQAKVRRQWHEDIARGQGFNIAPINQKLLATVAEEVWDAIRLEAVKKVSKYQYTFLRSLANVFYFLFPPLFFVVPTICHCHCHRITTLPITNYMPTLPTTTSCHTPCHAIKLLIQILSTTPCQHHITPL